MRIPFSLLNNVEVATPFPDNVNTATLAQGKDSFARPRAAAMRDRKQQETCVIICWDLYTHPQGVDPHIVLSLSRARAQYVQLRQYLLWVLPLSFAVRVRPEREGGQQRLRPHPSPPAHPLKSAQG